MKSMKSLKQQMTTALSLILAAMSLVAITSGQARAQRQRPQGNAAGAATQRTANKPQLALLPFQEQTGRQLPRGGVRAAQDVFVTELVKAGKFKVVEREQFEARVKEKNLSLSGEVDPQTAVKAGKLLSVNYLLTGSVTEYGMTDKSAPGGGKGNVSLRVKTKLIDTSTGEVVWADEVRAEESAVKVSVGGIGGGVDDDRIFDKLAKDCAQQVAAKLKSAKL